MILFKTQFLIIFTTSLYCIPLSMLDILFISMVSTQWKSYIMACNAHLFPTTCSVTLCWQFEIDHGGSIYTMEVSANTIDQGLIYCIVDSLDLKVMKRMLII